MIDNLTLCRVNYQIMKIQFNVLLVNTKEFLWILSLCVMGVLWNDIIHSCEGQIKLYIEGNKSPFNSIILNYTILNSHCFKSIVYSQDPINLKLKSL